MSVKTKTSSIEEQTNHALCVFQKVTARIDRARLSRKNKLRRKEKLEIAMEKYKQWEEISQRVRHLADFASADMACSAAVQAEQIIHEAQCFVDAAVEGLDDGSK